MPNSIIPADQPIYLLAIIATVAAGLFALDRNFRHPVISGSVLLFVLPPLLSNLRVIPFGAPTYDMLWDYAMPLALPMILLSANIRTILNETGPVLISFIIACIGAMAGALLMSPLLAETEFGSAIVGTLTASYIGGSVNFGATSQALGLDDPSVLAATLAADNMIGPILIALLSVFAGFSLISRLFPATDQRLAQARDEGSEPEQKPPSMDIADLAALLALSCVIFAIGELTKSFTGVSSSSILMITILSIVAGQVFPKFAARCWVAFDLGMILLYMVFIAAFAGANVSTVIANGPMIFFFVAGLATIQLILCLVLSKLFKLTYPEAACGLLAAATGPTIAAAFATSKNWRGLVTPCILAGLLGYVLGNFGGLAIAALL